MSTQIHDRGTRDRDTAGVSLSTVLSGLIMLTVGLLWLLDVGEVLEVTWTLVGSVLLLVIGVLLIAAARHGSHGGMIFLGVVLSAVVLLGSLASWPKLEGGVGDRSIAPETVEELENEYSWAVGQQVIDLTDLEFPDGTTTVAVRLGTGNVEILVPDDLAVRVGWNIGVGTADVFDREQSGVGVDGTYESDDYADADRLVELDVELGMGSLEVR